MPEVPLTGPIIQEMGNIMRAMGAAADYWWAKMLQAMEANNWTAARNFAKTLGEAIQNTRPQQLGQFLQNLRNIRDALVAQGASAEEIAAVEELIALIEEGVALARAAAAGAGMMGEGAVGGSGGAGLFVLIVVVVLFIALANQGHTEEMPSKGNKFTKNDLKEAREKFRKAVRQECPCSKLRKAAAGKKVGFLNAGNAGGVFGGAGGGGGFPVTGMVSGAAANASGQVNKNLPGGGKGPGQSKSGGAAPDPFAFPGRGGPPMAPPGNDPKSNTPTLPDARPQGACMYPICKEFRSARFG
jgi:hypothetical protein